MKLHFKLIICYIAAVFAVFFCVNYLGNRILEDSVTQDLKDEYYLDVQRIAGLYADLYYDENVSMSQVRKQMETYDELVDARIWIVNAAHYVIIDSRSTMPLFVDNHSDTILKQTFTENIQFEGVFDEPMMCISEPVIIAYSIRGYVCLFFPMQKIRDQSVKYMNVANTTLLIIAAVLMVTFAVFYFLSVYPIRKIRKAALEYSKGNYDYELKVRWHDEFRELADAMRYMVGEIQRVDEYQKKFIANISHDFRSPLTSIKGYVEAIKDGTIPPEDQDKYLDIIVFETDRLSKLTSNLLDLNRIDSNGLILDITSFDINAVIKRVAAAFEGACKEKRVVLNLVFASMATYVDADMGRIQQVLYNLTENAIKFSNPDSTVEIETEEKGSKVFIRVRDHGIGIAKENLGRIWDRFYKIDASRGKDKKGTGLGLSIVKEVITAHDENISVISTEGVGTEFTFSLAQSEG
ncbi:MAG: HAMP domain-containing histidine kinase [Lachnospiraceae bacterium]|nr:HAMP domain-containing histidine kinase [Lachnospiraceae bacterium]